MTDGNFRNAVQVREQNMLVMGEELGELYSALWQELTSLHSKWGHYVVLFGTNPERIELLNSTGAGFFAAVQTTLWNDTLIHLARMTDSVSSAGKPNLSFKRLALLIQQKETASKVSELVDVALKRTAFARDWRNRRIAHQDLALALNTSLVPLASASRLQVDDALDVLGKTLNCVSLYYFQSTTLFEFAADSTSGGSVNLLHYLRAGFEVEEQRKLRRRSGALNPEDMKRRII